MKVRTVVFVTRPRVTCRMYNVAVDGQFLLLPDDCCLHETLSYDKGFELTHFYVWLNVAVGITLLLAYWLVQKLREFFP